MRKILNTAVVTLAVTASLAAADLFPLRNGNTWTYREHKTGSAFIVSVGTPVLMNGHEYYSLKGYVDRQLLVRVNESNQLVYVNEEDSSEHVLTSFEQLPGAWWQAPFRTCDQEGQRIDKTTVHDGPAGPVSDVVELRYRTFNCADTGVESEQFAEHLGMLRRVEQSIAGPRTYDLVSARVGNLVFSTPPSAQFTVGVDDPSADLLKVTLTLRVTSGELLNLHFSSGQEYDVLVRRGDGTVAWRWSAGATFIQTLHDWTVSGEWKIDVIVPRPQPSGNENEPYTVQAWLTTTGVDPQFAATLPLPIAPIKPASSSRHHPLHQ